MTVIYSPTRPTVVFRSQKWTGDRITMTNHTSAEWNLILSTVRASLGVPSIAAEVATMYSDKHEVDYEWSWEEISFNDGMTL